MMERASNPYLFPLVREPASRWERTGISPRHERRFNLVTTLLLALFTLGWAYTIGTALAEGEPPPSVAARMTTNPLSTTAPPAAAFLTDALVRQMVPIDEYRGASGAVNVVIQEPGGPPAVPAAELPGDADLLYLPEGTPGVSTDTLAPTDAPARPGIWNLAVRMRGAVREVPNLHVLTLVPLSEARGGSIGRYQVGEWPRGVGGARSAAYTPPKGLVEVTPENMNLQVSEHFRLRDFLTKGQENVWPKYVVISPRLLDKLELTLQELEAMGHPVENVFVVSGFRHPHYNVHGGNPQGRGALSRHMYGDAADIAIDNDRNSRMDDLNGDGRVDERDARIVAEAAIRVERKHPHLIGGVGVYPPAAGHSGMVHIDTRGWQARW